MSFQNTVVSKKTKYLAYKLTYYMYIPIQTTLYIWMYIDICIYFL